MDDLFVPEDTSARLATHEAVCAERYANLLSRLGRLETVMIGAAAALIGAMGALLLTLMRVS